MDEFEVFETYDEAVQMNESYDGWLREGHEATIAMILTEVYWSTELLKHEIVAERARAVGAKVLERWEYHRYRQPELVVSINGIDLPRYR
jgi:hypothetical protein